MAAWRDDAEAMVRAAGAAGAMEAALADAGLGQGPTRFSQASEFLFTASSILLAAALDRGTLEAAAEGRLRRTVEVAWSSQDEAVVAREVERIDGLVVGEKPLPRVPPEAARAAMLEGLRQLGLDALPWTDEARSFRARIEIGRAHV